MPTFSPVGAQPWTEVSSKILLRVTAGTGLTHTCPSSSLGEWVPAQPQPLCCCAQSLGTPHQDSAGAELPGHSRRLELETDTSVVQHP